MLQLIDKKKYLLYLFIFFFLTTFNNLKLKDSKPFNIKDIEVVEESVIIENTIKENIKENLLIFKNENIFLIDKKQIETILSKSGWVSNYSIKKKYPSKLIINFKKAQPIASIIINNEILYLGSNFKIIKSDTSFQGLPKIFGEPKIKVLSDFIHRINSSSLNYDDISNIYYLKSGRWNLKINNDVLIKLPTNDILRYLNLAKKILDNENIISENTIDLTVKNQIIVN